MKFGFWMHFIINTGIALAEAYVAGNSNLSEENKAKLEKFIADGQDLLSGV